MYLRPWEFFRNQILLDYLGRWRNQSCQIFFQSVHSGGFGKGSNFAIFSVNRGWPLQLLYYRTTVVPNIHRTEYVACVMCIATRRRLKSVHFGELYDLKSLLNCLSDRIGFSSPVGFVDWPRSRANAFTETEFVPDVALPGKRSRCPCIWLRSMNRLIIWFRLLDNNMMVKQSYIYIYIRRCIIFMLGKRTAWGK